MRAGICTEIWDGYTFHTDVDWMKEAGIRGIVLWRHICFKEPAHLIPEWLFRHELEHAYQQIRDGRLRFYLKYIWYAMRYGYERNPYEVEAREKAHTPLTENEERLLWKLREGSAPSANA